MEISDFRHFIRKALAQKKEANPNYSLRAFAKNLEMSPQKLNSLLNRNAGLSLKAAQLVADKLELNAADKKVFLTLVEAHHSRSVVFRNLAKKDLHSLQSFESEMKELNENDFESVQNWKALAIYSLIGLKDFSSDPNWIANRLNISIDEALTSLRSLLATGLIIQNENGELKRSKKKASFFTDKKSKALSHYRKSLFDLAKNAVENEPVENRHFYEILVPIFSSDLPDIKNELHDFQKKIFTRLANRSEPSDRLYAITLGAFPLDQIENKSGVVK